MKNLLVNILKKLKQKHKIKKLNIKIQVMLSTHGLQKEVDSIDKLNINV